MVGRKILNKIFKRKKRYNGFVDGIHGYYLYGWVYNIEKPKERVEVSVFCVDKIIAEGIAHEFREDLLQAKIGDGFHAFRIKLPEEIFNTETNIRVFVKNTNFELTNSPFKIESKYINWIRKYEIPLLKKCKDSPKEFKYTPKISIIMPVYNTPEKFLRKAIESVIHQIYKNWELCIADDASTEKKVREILNEYKSNYSEKIKIVFREKNGHICEANNSALSLATGDYIAFLDHDDELAPHALYMVVEALNDNPDLKLIYSDEDKIDEEGIRTEPHFKSDWNPDLLLSQNYIAHLLVIKKEILDKIGGFRKGTEGAQDHDIVLRASLYCKESEIYHISHILYHWRQWSGSTALKAQVKAYAEKSGLKVIEDYLTVKGIKNFTVMKGEYNNTYRVKYSIPSPAPLVSIIIPTRDHISLLKRCIYSIINRTEYPNYEIIIVNHNSETEAAYNFFYEISSKYNNIKILRFSGEFNFSLINNFAARHTKGELLLFLNNDTEVINSEWLLEMVSQAVRQEIGCVGAKLFYPDGTIQHGGVILGLGGVAGHSHKFMDGSEAGYFRRLQLVQNLSAVTAACLMVKKSIFNEVGGFDAENLKVAFNDVDFCLRVRELKYRNLWTPYAKLYHHESKSRGREDTQEKMERFQKEIEFMKKKWGELLMKDPYYNPNLTLDREDFSIKE